MKLGFVSAILPEFTLERGARVRRRGRVFERRADVLAARQGRAAVRGRHAPRRDRPRLRRHRSGSATSSAAHGVAISGLGYYPEPALGHRAESETAVAHLHMLIDAAADLGVNVVNSFIGRDPAQSVEANWPRFLEVWRPLVSHAEERGVRIGIENCPMLFTARRVAGRQEPRDQPRDLAEDVRGDPEPELRPELRPVALDLAADGLPRPAGRVPRPARPRPRQGCPDRPRGARRSRRALLPEALAHAQDSRAWATCAGAPSSARSPTPATTATSRSRSRTGRSRARSRSGRSRWSSAADYLLQYMVG